MEQHLSGLKLAQAIDAIGITKAELARRCGVSRQWIHILCTTGTNRVGDEFLLKLMAHLRCRDKDLLVSVKN